jgi:hypothetical protein
LVVCLMVGCLLGDGWLFASRLVVRLVMVGCLLRDWLFAS